MKNILMTLKSRIVGKIVGRLNALVRASEWYNEVYWQGATKFWRHNTFLLDVVNTGSNTGKFAFDYSESGMRGFNMALGPQSLVHDFYILKNYFSYLRDGATVIIPLCPFSCLHSRYGKDANLKYYTFMHPATIIGFDESERTRALKIKENPFRYMPRACLCALLRELKSRVVALLKKNNGNNTDFEESARGFLVGWMNQFEINDLDAPVSPKHTEELNQRASVLRDMIDFCIERSYKPVLVMPPIHNALYSKFSAAFVTNYIEKFVEITNRPGVPFFNDMRLEMADSSFKNALFLNRTGAVSYTNLLLERIKLKRR